MNKNEPIRVAHIIGKWIGGGVEAVVMNYYRCIDKTKYQFDFLCDSDSTNIPYDEIEQLGGRVILIPPYQQIFKYEKELIKIFKKNYYKIVHSHINTLSIFPLRAAKKAGVPIRIAHSHSTTNKAEKKKNIMKMALRPFSKKYATHYFACTECAGRWLFGDSEFDSGNVFVLNNAIDINKFQLNSKKRSNIRNKLGIKDNQFVIGHIGRFMPQKNHEFIIDTFYEYSKIDKNSILLLIGQGPLLNSIKKKVCKLSLENRVIFTGQVDNTNDYYQVFDLFLFPSLYEGLGMVLIEAQCSGLPCLASTNVPNIVKMTESVYFMSLKQSASEWAEKIKMYKNIERKDCIKMIELGGYNIFKEVRILEKQYETYLDKYEVVNNMNVAVVTSGFLPVPATKGGAVENLIENTMKQNEKFADMYMTIFSIYDKNAAERIKEYKNSKAIFIKKNIFVSMVDMVVFFFAKYIFKKKNSPSYRFIFQRLYFFEKVSKYLKKYNYDKILLENHPSQYLTLKLRNNYKKYAGRYYYHCHNEFPSTYGCKDIMLNTAKFISVSQFRAKTVIEYLNLDNNKSIVVKNGIDENKFNYKITKEEKGAIRKKYDIKENEKIIVYAGRIVDGKGIIELLKALQKVKFKNYKLLLVGAALNDLNEKTNFELEVEKEITKLKNKVKSTGFVKYDEMAKLYKTSDLAIFPSIMPDSAPLTVIEAMTCGLPIITTTSGGIPEYANNKCACILNIDNELIDNIAKSIDDILSDDVKRTSMSKESLNASKKLTIENYYKNFCKAMEVLK
ncbi:glycosyltransferase [Streptococcus thermophilus]|nr:glycosyltransferase [Streptococcus thermophilus]